MSSDATLLLLVVSLSLCAGILLGRLAGGRRRLEWKADRHFDLSLDLFGTATFDGYFEDLNPAWERTLGYTTEELCSRPFIEFVHPDDRALTEAEIEKSARGIETVSYRNRYRTASGEYRWLEWNARPDEGDRKVYATARDVTAQVEAEYALRHQSENLERAVWARTKELEQSRLEILERLATTAEFRDDETNQHTARVGRTSARIARRLGLKPEDVELIGQAAPLHDIGKVGVPDAILRKPGRLTPDEFELVKQHVDIGAKILARSQFAVLNVARMIVLSHHERWDGSGYPLGLEGESIPLVGRIAAVADAFDALTHARPYKPAWPLHAAVAEIADQAGKQFDPEIVRAFLGLDHVRLLHPVRGVRPTPHARSRPAAMHGKGA